MSVPDAAGEREVLAVALGPIAIVLRGRGFENMAAIVEAAAAALQAQPDALADAARYRWLRGQFRTFSLDMGGRHSYCLSSGWPKEARGPTLDAAIDAAIDAIKRGS